MLTVNKLIPQGRGLARRAGAPCRQRANSTGTCGRKAASTPPIPRAARLGVFLPRGTLVRGGDVLVADDGSLVQRDRRAAAGARGAALQPSMAAPSTCCVPAYHLGNRHVALELKPDHLKLEPDHVLADMLRQQHLIVTATQLSAFEPEGGAYGGGGHGHGHDHAHDHDHGHGHADHGHAQPAAPGKPLAVPVVAAAAGTACAWPGLRPRPPATITGMTTATSTVIGCDHGHRH